MLNKRDPVPSVFSQILVGVQMSTLLLVIGNKNYSSWSLRPWILMRHMGLAFSEKRIALFIESMERELVPYFSNSKVPVLVDGDLVVWDSLAIMEYVSENYLNGQGWPADSKARAIARSVSAEMHSSFASLRAALPMNCRKKFADFRLAPEVLPDIDRVKAIWQKCRTEYGDKGAWLFGDFSIADAMFAPVALRFAGYDVPLNELLQNYVQSFLDHPDIIEWIAAGKQEKEIIESDEVLV